MNKRVKILDSGSIPIQTLDKIKDFASENHAGKVIGNTILPHVKLFTQAGFCVEGKIDGFFKGTDVCHILWTAREKFLTIRN